MINTTINNNEMRVSCCTEHYQGQKYAPTTTRTRTTTTTTTSGRLPKKNIIVEVSGSRFCIVPTLFQYIENLDWRKKKKEKKACKNGKEEAVDVVVVFKLNANPDIFEHVLQFFLSGKLPDKNKSSYRKAKRLIEFVAKLDQVAVKPLIDHMESILVEISSSSSSSLTSSSRKFLSRSLTSLSASVTSRTSNLIASSSSSSSSRQSSASITTTGSSITSSSKTSTGTEKTKSSIPSLINSFTTKNVDDGSISKLSLQSSSSSGLLSTQDENDCTVPTTTTSYAHQNVLVVGGNASHMLPQQYNDVQRGYGAYNTNNNNLYSSKTMPVTTSDAYTDIPGKSRQPQIIPNDPFTTITDNANRSNKRNIANKWRSSKKILCSVLGGDINNGRRLEMTHDEWCATEYVV